MNSSRLVPRAHLAASLAVMLLSAVGASGETITHTFAPGNFQGWQQVVIPGGDPLLDDIRFNTTNATFGSRMLWVDPVGDVGGLTVTNPAGTADYRGIAHNSAILRSPTFTLDGVNLAATLTQFTVTDISFSLLGGRSDVVPTNVSDIPAASINRPAADLGGFLGVALRRDSDNEYLTWSSRSGNGQSGFGSPPTWETLTLDSVTLAAAISGDPQGTLYTLDLIDAAHGDWGWVSMDSATFVAVPEPGSMTLLGFATLGIGLALRQRRSVA